MSVETVTNLTWILNWLALGLTAGIAAWTVVMRRTWTKAALITVLAAAAWLIGSAIVSHRPSFVISAGASALVSRYLTGRRERRRRRTLAQQYFGVDTDSSRLPVVDRLALRAERSAADDTAAHATDEASPA